MDSYPAAVARTLIAVAVALALALAGGGCGAGPGPERFDGAALPHGVLAPDFTLTDQNGRAVSLAEQRGHAVLLAFLGSDCRACTLAAQQIRGALDQLAAPSRVRTLLVDYSTATPSPARAAALLDGAALSGRADYLTGALPELRRVWGAYRLVLPPSESAIAVLLVDARGYERVEFGLEQLTPEALSHDIRLLIT